MQNNVYGLVGPFGYGPAYPYPVNVASPAAGANASVVIDGRWQARLIGARAVFTSDANAANRVLTIDYLDANNVVRLRNGYGAVVTASTSNLALEWDAHRSVAEWASNTPIFAPLAPWFLPSGWSVRFTATSIQVGDQWSGLSMWFENFETGRGAYQIGVVTASLDE